MSQLQVAPISATIENTEQKKQGADLLAGVGSRWERGLVFALSRWEDGERGRGLGEDPSPRSALTSELECWNSELCKITAQV